MQRSDFYEIHQVLSNSNRSGYARYAGHSELGCPGRHHVEEVQANERGVEDLQTPEAVGKEEEALMAEFWVSVVST